MSGYQNNPEATAAVIDKDGYFDTGALYVHQLLCHRCCSCCFRSEFLGPVYCVHCTIIHLLCMLASVGCFVSSCVLSP